MSRWTLSPCVGIVIDVVFNVFIVYGIRHRPHRTHSRSLWSRSSMSPCTSWFCLFIILDVAVIDVMVCCHRHTCCRHLLRRVFSFSWMSPSWMSSCVVMWSLSPSWTSSCIVFDIGVVVDLFSVHCNCHAQMDCAFSLSIIAHFCSA